MKDQIIFRSYKQILSELPAAFLKSSGRLGAAEADERFKDPEKSCY
tara:strand:+ start:315 stop:452 length:138 start_codon:yes stop_codon:yes gene_type:complete